AGLERYAVAHERDDRGRHSRRSVAPGDRPGRRVRGRPRRQDDRGVGIFWERLWTRNVTSTQMPWSAGDAVFVVDVNGKLMALARGDGKVRWITQLPGTARWN